MERKLAQKELGELIGMGDLVQATKVNDRVIDYMIDEEKVRAYCPGIVKDLITGDRIGGSYALYSDGRYHWHTPLIETMKRHHLTLKEEIIKKMLG